MTPPTWDPLGSQVSVSEVRCIWVTRVDSCPACGANNLDLSEDGLSLLCGYPCDYISSLEVTKLD